MEWNALGITAGVRSGQPLKGQGWWLVLDILRLLKDLESNGSVLRIELLMNAKKEKKTGKEKEKQRQFFLNKKVHIVKFHNCALDKILSNFPRRQRIIQFVCNIKTTIIDIHEKKGHSIPMISSFWFSLKTPLQDPAVLSFSAHSHRSTNALA